MKLLQPILKCAVGVLAISSCAYANSGINITQSQNSNKPVVVIETSAPSFVSNRLSAIDNIETYKGSCRDVERGLKRQVACITMNKNSVINISVPDINNGYMNTKIIQIDRGHLTAKEEIYRSSIIYKAITGDTQSILDTKLAYVSKHHNGKYILRTASYDGSDPQTIHESSEPILSPSWSPDGKYLTYVSFESIRASIFVQEVSTKRRIKALTLKGLNAYPSFEDNENLLVSLSNESTNSEIYRYSILNDKLTRLKQSNKADIFPQSINKNAYIKVSLSVNDVPYAYYVNKGKQKPVSSLPLNAVTISDEGMIAGLSGRNVVVLEQSDTGWGEMRKIAYGKDIESPSIASNGKAIYYSTKEKGRVFIKASSNQGKNILSFSVNNEDLIQISAL
ncbi:hypothetical protein OTK49_00595 [Vibrio coralliirubri]|uniref:hypothetical protein n=1 Tax=Vibrio coralliirubri TaxID=1516159 RepID=UPI002284BF89|nr:hypothetical protein [Vibrio coralliirubri]MCY9861040.1 hypothetical protein [Vibrio coralliirubri]